MADPKDTASFFRKVVKFVANPSAEWSTLEAPTDEARETEYAKGELKAMIERKRRNDFVRKREFDMLRKVRREGLSSEQLAALGGSSRLDDSEGRNAETGARQDIGVKAKIDEIEQQMVGDRSYATTTNRRPPEFYSAPTQPAAMEVRPSSYAPAPPRHALLDEPFGERQSVSAAGLASGLSPLSAPDQHPMASFASDIPQGVFAHDPREFAHDPDLDEAVIAFANADFEQCENAVLALTAAGGARAQHAETWLVLFDFYRAIGQQQKFEALASNYAQQFGWSAPQWFSMPKLVAAGVAQEERAHPSSVDGEVTWACPEYVDADAVARLASLALQMPLPWVFDWSALRSIDAEACARLSELFRSWLPQTLEMRWIGGEHLFAVLQDAAPTGVRDADPAFWQLRLDGLRMTNRPDQFDEAAIDYCVTYEVSPPSWEPARCVVRVFGSGQGSGLHSSSLSVVSEASTTLLESRFGDEASVVKVGSFDLAGQLVGDIGDTLKKMDAELQDASVINVSCARLIRVDFIAAGDLLNWVLARRTENRNVSFIDAHRMVALFFGAMGINEHARVKVRIV